MKRFFLITCLNLILNLNIDNVHAQGVNFQALADWNAVLAKAKAENKFIFVDCYATWCGPCKAMDEHTFPDKQIGIELNSKFISVKLQLDKPIDKSVYQKKWFAEATQIGSKYNITAYPTFLFLSPDGKLLYKSIGYQSVNGFLKTIQSALVSNKDLPQLVEDYQSGKLSFAQYPILIKKLKTINDNILADEVTKKYIKDYLDRLPEKEFLTKEYMEFCCFEAVGILDYENRFTKLALGSPHRIDSALNKNGQANYSLGLIITEQEIDNRIKALKEVKDNDWQNIYNTIKSRYGEYFTNRYLLGYKTYYYSKKDWKKYADAVDEYLKLNLKLNDDPLLTLTINNWSWDVFVNCDNSEIIERAIGWINIAISKNDDERFIDTKANLLYKAGHNKDAIASLQTLIDVKVQKTGKPAKECAKDFLATLEKMKNGESTWKDQVW